MDFDHILRDWEEQKQRKSPKKKMVKNPKSEKTMSQDWLDLYPPDQKTVQAKSHEKVPPKSEGTSIWYRRPHQDTLDLHGLTAQEAQSALHAFIASMRRRGLRKGLVIHGKGKHSPSGSVLKPFVEEYLLSSKEVGDFAKAPRKDGGSGATWFLLRQRSR
ncbi:MAG: Smr/MutS family protein [Spirochaetales bacterium]|nr:Smr/MutS family protein [Spirochaetales bacterium]